MKGKEVKNRWQRCKRRYDQRSRHRIAAVVAYSHLEEWIFNYGGGYGWLTLCIEVKGVITKRKY